ncbi:restriction endonuclease subunit S [Parabacteroides johnsonii]|uniref:restriction endonuclease subunit S n=1 Tax=Parabacteroides johnsonii TaxID=387661 RepID=UPI0024323435|nr:restriction endonuclease subunit S [Parabacteroides johnsonii]
MTKDKDTKTVVPALRFPEFRDGEGWKIVSLGEVCDVVGGGTPDTKEDSYWNGDILWLTPSEVGNRFISDSCRKITLSGLKNSSAKLLPAGSIVLTTRATLGEMSILVTEASTNQGFQSLVPKLGTNKDYIYYLQPIIKEQCLRFSKGSTFLEVSSTSVKNFKIPFTSNKEQEKVADCLGSMDDLISSVADKIETLKEYKKGLMLQLFPAEGKTIPAFRFPEFQNAGEWMLLPIKKCNIDILTGYAFKGTEILEDNDGIPLMRGINITEGVVRHNNDIDRFYSGEDHTLSKYRLLCNDLVIAMDGSKVGRNFALINKQDEGSLLVQRVARLRADNIDFIMFIYQQIGSDRFKKYIDRINTSSGIPHISLKQIEDFKIWTTRNDKEFRMVTNCLSSVDELISTEIAKLDQLKAHKKGLMQQLFPKLQ